MNNTKENGVTLISLTVTIILILILTTLGLSAMYNRDMVDTTKQSINDYDISKEEEEIEQMSTNLDKIKKEEINKPLLKQGMTPIKWIQGVETVTTKNDDQWYNYKSEKNPTDSAESLWANVKLNGSYFVWIPRFAYKITYYTSEDKNTISSSKTQYGKIDVKFLIGISDSYYDTETSQIKKAVRCTSNSDTINTTTDYVVHPAFTKESNIQYRNGGWNEELSGIWVAKYEMSMETNGESTNTNTELQGNVQTSNIIKMVSKPNVNSWRHISANNAFTNCLAYNENANSHLMKNSEWGAVSYLTYSQYGRNGNEVYINNSSLFITGNSGGSSTSDDTTAGTANVYTTDQGQMASSTGNITGIYDLSGGSRELVSAYIETDNTNGNEIVSARGKYANHYVTYSDTIYGDGIFETSQTSSGYSSWNNDESTFTTSTYPFLLRGGKYNDGTSAGIFAYSNTNGKENENDGFRVVLN